jgi:nucleoside-diphosphate-sugar epimerase
MFETGVILVTGAKGMVGSAVCRILHRYPARQILTPDKQELDLSNQARVDAYFDSPDIVNVGTGKEISIRDLAALIVEKVGYTGEIRWDTSKPDGMLHKCLEISKITNMGFKPRITLEEGIRRTIAEYRQIKLKGKLFE